MTKDELEQETWMNEHGVSLAGRWDGNMEDGFYKQYTVVCIVRTV